MFGIFPQDEYALYDAPAESLITVTAPGVTVLVPADPTRVILVFSQTDNSHSPVTITTSGTASSGLYIPSASSQAMVLNANHHAPLVTAAWWGWIPGGVGSGTITVITARLRRNPKMYGYGNVFKEATSSEPQASYRLPSAKPGRVKVPSNRAILRFLHERRPDLFGEG